MICPECGAETSDDYGFCPRCGSTLDKTVTPEPGQENQSQPEEKGKMKIGIRHVAAIGAGAALGFAISFFVGLLCLFVIPFIAVGGNGMKMGRGLIFLFTIGFQAGMLIAILLRRNAFF